MKCTIKIVFIYYYIIYLLNKQSKILNLNLINVNDFKAIIFMGKTFFL